MTPRTFYQRTTRILNFFRKLSGNDLRDNGRIDAPEVRAKIERGIHVLQEALV